MEEVFTIRLPETASKADAKSIEEGLKKLDGIKDAGSESARGIDPGTVMLWVQAGSGVLSAVSSALPLVKKIRDSIRGKGISGATIETRGIKISLDSASTSDIEQLIRVLGKK